MTSDDRSKDREIESLLRAFDAPAQRSREELDRLASRIVSQAEPLLDARRDVPPVWWNVAAGWARTLIPVGATTALIAAAIIFWAMRHPAPVPELARAEAGVTRDDLSQRLLYSIVAPIEQQVVPASSSATRREH